LLTETPRPAHSLLVTTQTKLARGAAAELLAAQFLQSQGLLPLARNLRCRAGELDLVFLDRDVLVIVEVRQRASVAYGGALASVNLAKQRKIVRTTQFFWQRQPKWHTLAMRFDVVGVEGLPDGTHRVVWIKDAFHAR
jgi:putative endonuclease